jgi:hypothetical protein
MKELDLFKEAGLPTDLSGLANAYQTIAAETTGLGGKNLLRMDKSGEWCWGQESMEVDADSEIAFDPRTLAHGYISWGEGKVVGEEMMPFNKPKPEKDNLPHTGEQWNEQLSIAGKFISGEDAGVEIIYKTTSVGGLQAIRTLSGQIAGRLNEGIIYCVPICKLQSSSYTHKQYGKIFKPELVILRWYSIDGKPEGNGQAEQETEDQPVRRRRRRSTN